MNEDPVHFAGGVLTDARLRKDLPEEPTDSATTSTNACRYRSELSIRAEGVISQNPGY